MANKLPRAYIDLSAMAEDAELDVELLLKRMKIHEPVRTLSLARVRALFRATPAQRREALLDYASHFVRRQT